MIHSMRASLPTLPALLEHIGYRARNRVSLFQIAIILIAGGAHAASMAWPFPFLFTQGQPVWWLQLLALTLLVDQLDGSRSWKRSAALGGLFATAMLCATFWWLFISMHDYGGLATPLTVLAIVLLAVFLALYYAAAGGLFAVLAPVRGASRALVFAALWLLAELARVKLFTGFPWGRRLGQAASGLGGGAWTEFYRGVCGRLAGHIAARAQNALADRSGHRCAEHCRGLVAGVQRSPT
jgi:apolipoprotein N-acyltransferase